jgi:hypothetical protein
MHLIMSTLTREPRSAPALPNMARGDAIFGAVSVLAALLALLAKVSGIVG